MNFAFSPLLLVIRVSCLLRNNPHKNASSDLQNGDVMIEGGRNTKMGDIKRATCLTTHDLEVRWLQDYEVKKYPYSEADSAMFYAILQKIKFIIYLTTFPRGDLPRSMIIN